MFKRLLHITSKNVKCTICDAKAVSEEEFKIRIFNDKLNEKAYGPTVSLLTPILSFGMGFVSQRMISPDDILHRLVIFCGVTIVCLFVFGYVIVSYILKESLLRINLWEEHTDIKGRYPQKGYIEIWNEIEKAHFPDQQYK